MIKIRLSFDNHLEKEAAIETLKANFDVKSVSKDYFNGDGKSFRVYVDVELKHQGE